MLQGWGISPESSWHWGFGAAAVGMFLGLLQYTFGGKRLGQAGLSPAPVKGPEETAARKRVATIAGVSVLLLLAALVGLSKAGIISVTADGVGRVFGWLLLATVVIFFLWLFLGGDWTKEERKRLMVIFVLFLAAAVFWSVFEQAGSTLNLFAERGTNNSILGLGFPASSGSRSTPPFWCCWRRFSPRYGSDWGRGIRPVRPSFRLGSSSYHSVSW